MNELLEWLEAHRIACRPIDREAVEIEGFGKVFLADLSGVESIFRRQGAEVQFNLMERPEVLLAEGIEHVAFPFGDNWYYYSLREGFALNILKYVGKRIPCKRQTPFVHLGVHTPYELLNASGDVSLWVKKAVWMGHKALGIADRNTMGATLALQKECAKAGITPVFGYTCTLVHDGERVEVKIYCQSQRGLRNLLRIQKAVMVDASDATLPLPELLRRGAGNVLVLGRLSSFWMERNPHVLKALRECFDKVFYQVDLSEYKAERLDAEVLKATAHFFDTFYDKTTDRFAVEPVLIPDCHYPDKDEARTKIVLNKIATGAAHGQRLSFMTKCFPLILLCRNKYYFLFTFRNSVFFQLRRIITSWGDVFNDQGTELSPFNRLSRLTCPFYNLNRRIQNHGDFILRNNLACFF